MVALPEEMPTHEQVLDDAHDILKHIETGELQDLIRASKAKGLDLLAVAFSTELHTREMERTQ